MENLPRTHFRAPRIIHAESSPVAALLHICARVARSDSTVLLTGETGTGKEVFARFLHEHSSRASGPFVPVNCGAIPETLLESEFFGYERGAFTGATRNRKGRFAAAEGGTLFLDEVGELPLAMQVKLLRVLQERAYEPVGSVESVATNVRVIAATHRDLEADAAAGRFRRDLYYRLFVCPVELPPLRARPMDVPLLFQTFWAERGQDRPVDAAVVEALCRYSWPGNVREMENLVERMSVIVESGTVTLADLAQFPQLRGVLSVTPVPATLTPAVPVPPTMPLAGSGEEALGEFRGALSGVLERHGLPRRMPELLEWFETVMVDAALSASHGNKRLAAHMLGLQRTTLVEKLRRRERAAGAPARRGGEEEAEPMLPGAAPHAA
ncbi:MAG: sigma 54-interacting transcriptional regulator [Deltaproteobacteria bacterium]|nr:sigma 54-interacting transcriptional regulator [Deltaproteobacteria bacterium]